MTTISDVPVRTQADALALLKETVEFYSPNPKGLRAVMIREGKEFSCLYATPAGLNCAVGRCLSNPETFQEMAKKSGMNTSSFGAVLVAIGLKQDQVLRPEYRGYPVDLWQKLQDLHDKEDNWSAVGLNVMGRATIAGIGMWIKKWSGLPQAPSSS